MFFSCLVFNTLDIEYYITGNLSSNNNLYFILLILKAEIHANSALTEFVGSLTNSKLQVREIYD